MDMVCMHRRCRYARVRVRSRSEWTWCCGTGRSRRERAALGWRLGCVFPDGLDLRRRVGRWGLMDRCAPARHADVRRCRQVLTVVSALSAHNVGDTHEDAGHFARVMSLRLCSMGLEWAITLSRPRCGTASCVHRPRSLYIIALSKLMNSRHI